MSMSPLIANGDLVLTPNGQLQGALDIQTQMTVTVSAYNCLYNTQVNSQLIPYIFSIPVGGFTGNTITNIVVAAYKILINNNIITNLTVAVLDITLGYVTIKITAVDIQGNSVQINWDNTNLV